MLKKISLIIFITMILLVGCKVEDGPLVETESAQTVQEVEVVDNENIEEVVTEDAVESTSEEALTVDEDVYVGESLEQAEDISYSEGEEIQVSDTEQLAEMQTIIKKFFYNYLFNENHLGIETGEITADDMQLFAISYKTQYEYNELTFDTNNFVLHIPEEDVTQVIKRFFDYDFTDHTQPVNTLVTYEDGFYLMPVFDVGTFNTPEILSVTKTSDFTYKVMFEEPIDMKPIDDPDIYYEAILEERDSRFIMIDYKKFIVYPEEEVEETTENETTEEKTDSE